MSSRDKEINIIDLFVEVALHWRGMIIAAVVGAVLLGAAGYAKNLIAYKNQDTSELFVTEDGSEMSESEKNQAYLESKMTITQIENVKTVLAYENAVTNREDYLYNSPYMKLDPRSYALGQLEYVIKSDTPDEYHIQENNIRLLYKSMIETEEAYRTICDITGIEDIELGDIVTVTDGTPSPIGDNIFCLRVKYWDKDICEKIVEAYDEYFIRIHDKVAFAAGGHELVLVDKSVIVESSTVIDADRKQVLADIATYRNSANNVRKLFTDKELAYYNYMRDASHGDDSAYSDAPLYEKKKPTIGKKFVLAGFVGFAFLYALLWALLYIFNDKIKCCENYSEHYGIDCLGYIRRNKYSKKGPGTFIDRLISSIRTIGERVFFDDEAAEIVVSSIKASVKKNQYKSVALIGCDRSEYTKMIFDKIMSGLQDNGVEVSLLKDVIYRPEVMQEIKDIDTTILIERVGGTYYSELLRELDFAKQMDMPVLGIVVVE